MERELKQDNEMIAYYINRSKYSYQIIVYQISSIPKRAFLS